MTINEATALKSNMHATFDTPQGKEVMAYLDKTFSWLPNVFDSGETNDIIARDANRKLLGTIKTILTITPEQMAALTREG